MEEKCSGCDAAIDSLFMECSQPKCKKKFHLICLALTTEQVEAFTPEYRSRWICPECTCTMPKRGNADTPVRGNTTTSKPLPPNSYVNTNKRGSCLNTSEIMDTENQLLNEMREFRWEVKSQLEQQRKEYDLLQNRFITTETELKELKQILEVVRQKASKVDTLETRIKTLIERNENLEASLKRSQARVANQKEQDPKPSTPSFANVVKEKQVVVKNVPVQECVATKTAKPVLDSERTSRNVAVIEKEELEKEGHWTTVARKKNRYSNSEVKKGGNTSSTDIQGTEKKRFLHVWRLQKETTIESLEKHISKIYDEKVPVKIEKIKHKTERDYASFIIGVPESKYEKLCLPESWAVNIEFAEWVWFRRPANESRNLY